MPIEEVKVVFDKTKEEALEWFQKEISSLRSGRVKPNLVESLPVESYGTRTPLNGLASVTSSDARTLVVAPWDKSTMSSIEKAITQADLGVQPVVDGDVIRLSFPSLTEEVREKVIRILHSKAEEARVRLRQGRDEALRVLKQEKEKGDATEDDFYDGRQELDKLIQEVNDEVAEIVKKKEADINTV